MKADRTDRKVKLPKGAFNGTVTYTWQIAEPPGGQQHTGERVCNRPSHQELTNLAAIVAAGMSKTPREAITFALGIWREAAIALRDAHNERGHAVGYDLAQFKPDEVDESFGPIPRPKVFPAKLDDFLRLIVNAKTPADSMRRFRDYVRNRYKHSLDEMPVEGWLQIIREDDRAGGAFPPATWHFHARSYRKWWKHHISQVASQAARRRKKSP